MAAIEVLIGIAAGALGSTVIWLLLGPRMSGKGLERWIRRAMDDQDKRETLYTLFDLMLRYASERKINTGAKIKVPTDKLDEAGKPIMQEIDEIVTPVELIARSIGHYVMMKFRASTGGVKTQLNKAIQEGLASEGMALSPQAMSALSKGKLGPAIAEAVLPELVKRLNKQQGNTGGW